MVHLLLLQQPLILLPARCGKQISQQVLRLCSLGSGIPHSSTSPTLYVPGPPPLRAALLHSKREQPSLCFPISLRQHPGCIFLSAQHLITSRYRANKIVPSHVKEIKHPSKRTVVPTSRSCLLLHNHWENIFTHCIKEKDRLTVSSVFFQSINGISFSLKGM